MGRKRGNTKKTFNRGDRVTLAINSAERRVEATVDEVRPDGKLLLTLGDGRQLVRSATFIDHTPENVK
jgi:regulator of sirC expression with transglutaminase-like and TPR domain